MDSKDLFVKLVDEGPADSSKLLKPEEILSDEDKLKPEVQCGPTDKPKKPCANCTCGLAEELNNVQQSAPPSKSSCGSCYLGDAFRCASCPYKGMPAFKPGEKVTIDTSSDDF